MKNLNDLSKRIHDNAVKHGFWAERPSGEHCLMLVITEIAEMVEADRKGNIAVIKHIRKQNNLAAAQKNAFALCKGLSRDNINIFKRIQFGLHYITGWAKSQGVNLDWHVEAKMRFNATRPMKHGKAY